MNESENATTDSSVSAQQSAETVVSTHVDVDRDTALKNIRAAVANVDGVVEPPSSALQRVLPHGEHDVSLRIGRTSVTVGVTIGATYPRDLVALCESVRKAISETLQNEMHVIVRRVNVSIAYLQHKAAS